MTRDEFLEDVLDSCRFFWREVMGEYRDYKIIGITSNIVHIRFTFHFEGDEFETVLEYPNDSTLIENLITEL